MNRGLITSTLVVLVCFVVAWRNLPKRPLAADVFASEQIIVDDEARNSRIVLPHRRSTRCPLVIAFHGAGDSTESMANYSRLEVLAAEQGFILVYMFMDAMPSNLERLTDPHASSQGFGRYNSRSTQPRTATWQTLRIST